VVPIDVATDGTITHDRDVVTVGTGQVYGVEADDTHVFAVVEGDSGTEVAAFTAADGSDSGLTGFPATLSNITKLEDTAIVGTTLVVLGGTDDVVKVSLDSGTVVTPNGTLGARTYVDAYPYETSSVAYLADSGGTLARFGVGTNDYTSSLVAVADTVTAVGLDAEEGYLVLGAGDDALVYSFTTGPGTLQNTISGAADIDEFAITPGYAFGGTSDGSVHILTERPWIVADVSPTSAVDGDTVSLTFASDTAGTYQVRVGGTVAGDGADIGVDGTIGADEPVTVDLEVGDDFEEGDNRVWVFVTSGDLVGHAAGTVAVDNPPSAVDLGADDVGFGNQSISIQFDGISDADLAGYVIYVTDEPFDPADYPTGGPGFTGDDDVTLPLAVTAEAGASVSRTVSPLTNGTTYYVAVRAIDGGGLEGPMSDVQSATPEETFSASQLAGEEGGYCGVGPGAGLAAVLVAAAGIIRRRRGVGAAGAALAVALVAPAAHAKDTETPRRMNVQLRYGPTTLDSDPYLAQIYGTKANQILWFEYGFASQYLDANLGLGFYQELGWLQTAEGDISDEHDMLTLFPLALTLTGRLDFFHEQPIVPFGRIGADYWMWKENWYVADPDTTDDSRDGGKYGWHFGGGVMLLLDVLDRGAASRLESTAGIDDTYLVAEYRKTLLVHGDDQLNFSTSEFSFGLKFDF
jgi:hypothetical protein